MKKNYCGNYGCKNCVYNKVYPSNDYWTPDEYECTVPYDATPDFELSDEEFEDVLDRVWGDGEEWNTQEEQICPYYREDLNSYF